MRRLEVVARDPDLVPRGYLPYTRCQVTPTWLGVGPVTVDLPATDRVMSMVGAGWGVLVLLDGVQIMSASIEDIERDKDGGENTVSITGADDLAVVANALAWPDPTQTVGGQTTDTHDARSGAAETVIKGYVGANVGSGRSSNRADGAAPNVRTLTIAADQARGGTVSYKARFTRLLDVIRAAHGGLGATVFQDDSRQLVFDVVQPRDLTSSATFSFELGNLRRAKWSTGLSETTRAIAAGGGEGTARTFRERLDSVHADAWRQHVEEFIDQRHTTDTGELDQAGDEALEDGARTGVISSELVDTARLAYLDGYRLGDRVRLTPEPGTNFTDIVTSVKITADADAGTVDIHPSVGWQNDALYETRQDRQVAKLWRHVSALERSQ